MTRIIGRSAGDVNGHKGFGQMVKASYKYQHINLLKHGETATGRRWEAVDLVLAFCYGSAV